MADRGRVIYDIERCVSHVPDACRDCSKHIGDLDFDPIPCMEDLLSDALALLREQEAVEPLGHESMWFCGVCRYAIPRTVNYCPKCGMAVKWDE